MKYLILKKVLLVLSFGFFITAQSQTIQTKEQQQLHQKQKEIIKGNKYEFTKTLTQEQLSILNNKKLSIQERKRLFAESLSQEQTHILDQNRSQLRTMKQEFKTTLSDDQKRTVRRMNRATSSGESSGKLSRVRRKGKSN